MLQLQIVGAFFYLGGMHSNQPLRLLFSFALALLFFACENQSAKSETANEIFKDSISFWVEKKNAPDKAGYSRNLQKALKAVQLKTNDSIKSVYSLQLSLKFQQERDSVHFWIANRLAMSLAQKRNDSAKIAAAYWDRADHFENNEVIDSAYYNYSQAHKLYLSLSDDYNVGRMLLAMTGNLSTIKDYTTAETYAIQAIGIFKDLEHEDNKVEKNNNIRDKLYYCYNLLGIVTNALKDYDKALAYHSKALEYLDLMEEKGMRLASSRNNIGSVYLGQGKYELAIEQFKKVIATDSISIKNPTVLGKALSNYGSCEFMLGDTINSVLKLKRSIIIKDSIGDKTSLSRSYFNMSEIMLAKKDTAKALAFAMKAKKLASETDNNLRVLETLHLLRSIEPQNANTYFEEYKKLGDSLQIAERRSRNKFERIRFETNETLAENEWLSEQKQLWTGIAAIALLLGIATYIIIDQRRKNEKLRFQEEQQESNRRIFDLLLSEQSKIEEGKQLAQKRISEELHDAVQSRLQGIRMLLLGLNKRTTQEAIDERADAIVELKNVQEEVRAISHEISHAAYQKIYSFISTVQELLSEVQKNAGLESKFNFDETFPWDDLDADIKINVYRIIQESIQNCVKYAEADLAILSFDVSNEQELIVRINDNGKGFQYKTSKKGIGMRNINSRVKKLNGTWEIKSNLGEGTDVILYIPITKADSSSAAPDMKIA